MTSQSKGEKKPKNNEKGTKPIEKGSPMDSFDRAMRKILSVSKNHLKK